jgi:hypothetical protein
MLQADIPSPVAGKIRTALVLSLAVMTSLISWQPRPAFAQGARTPLLIEGKKTLYQRVLTRPGAALSPKPGAPGGKPIEPFTLFYVYERSTDGGAGWLLVGAGADGKTQGYLRETDAVPWRHAITLSFAQPTNRERVLFFRDRGELLKFVNSPSAAADTQRITKDFAAKGTLGANSAVIAAEPERFVDLQKQFYLLPVLEASSTVLQAGFKARTVKVASITRDAVATPAKEPEPANDSAIANFNSAVVFVIDATSSMQPYIDRTRSAMQQVLEQADQAKVSNRIRFGVVAFQDDPAKTKGVEYLSKVFADPNQTTTREQFLGAIQKVQATKSSTRAYAEDAYAALDEALKKIDWQKFGGRYIVYITDRFNAHVHRSDPHAGAGARGGDLRGPSEDARRQEGPCDRRSAVQAPFGMAWQRRAVLSGRSWRWRQIRSRREAHGAGARGAGAQSREGVESARGGEEQR